MSTYSSDADIVSVFGTVPVAAWADPDGAEIAEDIAARKELARTVAYERINEVGRATSYRIPFETAAGETPETIRWLEATLAGIWLYESKGVQDVDKNAGTPYHRLAYIRNECRRTMEEIRTHVRILDAKPA